MVGTRSVLLAVSLILYTTSLEVAVIIAMTGPVIDATIGPVLVMENVGVLMVEAVMSLDDLVKSPSRGGLAIMSSMTQDVVLGVRGPKGALVEVEALLHIDPLPVVAQQPRVVLRRQRELAKAGLPLIGEQSTPSAKGPVLLGLGKLGIRRLNIWESWPERSRPSRRERY